MKLKINFKHIILIIAILLLGLSAYVINQTYSKYLSTAEGESSADIAKWHILVNTIHITSGTDLSNTIEPIFPGNDHISEGIIAPTAEGYFDLELDFQEVDVSFKYTISTAISDDSAVSDLVLTGYSFDEGTTIIPFTTQTSIEETINLGSTIDSRNIRVYLKWDDDVLTQTMNNEADTLTTTDADNAALVDIIVDFTQITE